MSRKALIVVDVQNDFADPKGTLYVPKGEEVIAPINKIVQYARAQGWLYFTSCDWHSATTSHFEQWPVHCVRGSWGAQFHLDLDRRNASLIEKGVHADSPGYSAFEHMMFERLLRERDARELFICGLATDYCVKATALDAARLGFKVYLITDAIRAVNLKAGDGEKAIEEMVKAGVVLTTSSAVLVSL